MAETERVSKETARGLMQGLMDSYDIDQKDLVIDQGPEAIETIINRLVRAIRKGAIEILDDGTVKHNLQEPKGDTVSLIYVRLNGNAMKARDKASGNHDKHCALMGSLCTMPPDAMSKLDAVDISIFERLSTLFMVV